MSRKQKDSRGPRPIRSRVKGWPPCNACVFDKPGGIDVVVEARSPNNAYICTRIVRISADTLRAALRRIAARKRIAARRKAKR